MHSVAAPARSESSARTDRQRLVNRRMVMGMGILGLQLAATNALSRSEYLPSPPPLDQQLRTIGPWVATGDTPVEQNVLEVLGPDDILDRRFLNTESKSQLGLLIAYYRTQHRAKNAHDPKVCLPGSGWNPVESRPLSIPVPGQQAIAANYYVVSKPPHESVVVYWYQTHRATFATDQTLHFRRILDTVIENRTDMALVRIMVPVVQDRNAAAREAVAFVQSLQPHLQRQFPSL
jgi:EpsI family protein